MAKRKGPEATGLINGLGASELLDIYTYLQLTRQTERVLSALYRQNRVIGGLYRSLGQEATAVGSAFALRRASDGTGDVIAPAIRNLGALFVMGARPADVMMQYMARSGSPTRGREQNVHFSDLQRGYVGLISHLGVMIEVMAGVALSFRLRGQDRVALTYIGDGGASTGAFHEGFSFAAAQKAPLIVIVENNGYAYSTPTARQTAARAFVDKAAAYGCYGQRCDGNDVFDVYSMVRSATAQVRAGHGPALLEVLTYRRLGHAEHDDQHYVPAGEIESWEARDPLVRFENRVLENGWLDEALLAGVREKVEGMVDRARAEAEASPMPGQDEAATPVMAGVPIAAPWTRQNIPDPHGK